MMASTPAAINRSQSSGVLAVQGITSSPAACAALTFSAVTSRCWGETIAAPASRATETKSRSPAP